MQFELYRLTVREAGADAPMSFETRMKNATPPGEIQSAGKFGPWQFGEPAATPVSGDFSFQNADLSVFKGVLGTLSATGNYRGVLDRIETDGQTDTPNFALAISGQPVHLTARFHAIVDGTDGNTYLDPVEGHFGRSTVIARGSVVGGLNAKGRVVTLDATVINGRLQDLLRLAINSKDVMTGAVSFQSKMVIPPDDVDVAQKLQLDGSFSVGEAHFSKLSVQEKVSELSNRGSGEPKESNDDNIASDFRGRFKLNHGLMTFSGLSFNVPGVRVALDGTYGLSRLRPAIESSWHSDFAGQAVANHHRLEVGAVEGGRSDFQKEECGRGAADQNRGNGKRAAFRLGWRLAVHAQHNARQGNKRRRLNGWRSEARQ